MVLGLAAGWDFRAFAAVIPMAHLAWILYVSACPLMRGGLPLGDMACGGKRILTIPPHPPLRGTFSRKGRRKKSFKINRDADD